jgi:hypothetical protein
MFNDFMQSVSLLSVFMFNDFMLSVVTLSAIILSVMASLITLLNLQFLNFYHKINIFLFFTFSFFNLSENLKLSTKILAA